MATSWAITPPTGVESTHDTVASTDVRDVSDVLDLLALKDTPLLNRLKWGSDVHNKIHSWITEDLGPGYVILSGQVASDASYILIGTSGIGNITQALDQIHTGTILKSAKAATNGYVVVEKPNNGSNSTIIDFMSGTSALLTAAATMFIVGSPVNEGSSPRIDRTRERGVASNKTMIFREDVRLTGTDMATKYYGVANQLQHQIEMRAIEYWRTLESAVLLSRKDAGSSTETQVMGGVYDYLRGQSGSHIDTTTTTLDEASLNTVAAAIYDKGGSPNAFVCGSKQARQINTFDRARVRVEQDSKVAGFNVKKYMTDLGVELDILITRRCPARYAFVLDLDSIDLRAMKGRKYELKKLAVTGDFVNYQLISEVTMEFRGYSFAQHGMFSALT